MYAILLTALASCSDSGVVEESGDGTTDVDQISFVVQNDNYVATKGTPINFGYLLPSISVVAYDGADLFVEREATAGGSVWALSPSQNWGDVEQANFVAYSPSAADNNGVAVSHNQSQTTITYSVPATSAAQPDLMVAQSVGHKGETIPLNFKHQLACVAFSVKGDPYKIIESVTLKGVVSQATLVMDNATGTTQWQDKVIDPNNTIEVTIGDDTAVESKPNRINTSDGYLMMVPQELTAQAKVSVAIFDKFTGEHLVKTLSFKSDVEWVASCTYNYVIDIPRDADKSVDYTYEEPSNCYMIHPTGEAQYVYIPVEERINEFWGDTKDTGRPYKYQVIPVEGNMLNDTQNEWYPEIAWHDSETGIADLLVERATSGFIGEDEAATAAADAKKLRLGDPDFKTTQCSTALLVTVPPTLTEGNVLVVIKGSGDQILWSFHLWITSYNPYLKPELTRGTETTDATIPCEYNVGNTGYIHRYNDKYMYDYDGSRNAVWKKGEFYWDKYIMDRNIGARDVYTHSGNAGAIYYQPGRKDPMPGNVVFYPTNYDRYGREFNYGPKEGASGNFPYNEKSSQKSLIYSVQNPVSYCYYSNSLHWCSLNGENTGGTYYRWNDRKAYFFKDAATAAASSYATVKSLFDPSPLGWMVPLPGAMNAMATTDSSPDADDLDVYAPANGLFAAFPGTDGSGWVIFPYNGYRYCGSISAPNSMYLWVDRLDYNSNRQYCIYRYTSSSKKYDFLYASYTSPKNAYSVRCVQQYVKYPTVLSQSQTE